jgi:hypothetical protein
VSLIEGDNADCTEVDNCLAITTSPCVSEVFELCLVLCMECWLQSHELQFGFEKNGDCCDAIYTVRGVEN